MSLVTGNMHWNVTAKEDHVYDFLQMVKKTTSHTHIHWESRIKRMWLNVHIWGMWVKGTWEFFVVFLQLFCKSEIIQKYKVRGGKKLNFITKVVRCSLKKLEKGRNIWRKQWAACTSQHEGTKAYTLIHSLPVLPCGTGFLSSMGI